MNDLIREDLIDTLPLEKKTNEITKNILEEENVETVKDLINEFNLNQTKKDALRVLKYSSLLDNISDEIIERFKKRPDNFTNSDLLQYLQSIQVAMEKSHKSLNNVSDITPISITQINVNQEPLLDRDSRDRVAEAFKAIKALLDKKEEPIEPDSVIIEQEGDNNSENE